MNILLRLKCLNILVPLPEVYAVRVSCCSICMIIILSFLFSRLNAQTYNSFLIPDSLKENANAVIREYVRELELHGVNNGTERIRKIITILDNNGDDFGTLNIGYDKNSKVTIYEAAIYDKNGKRVKKISQSAISDIPSSDGVSLYSDNRQKVFKPSYGDYPYTVEYEYEIAHTNLISYGRWFPLYGYNISIEHSKFTFIHPSEIQFKKKEINLISGSEIKNNGNKVIESWSCDFLKALEYEPFAISLADRLPKLFLMPVKLVYDNHTGDAGNWSDYGKWINDLYEGRDVLAETDKIKVAKILENNPETNEKIRLLYEYMQENTRYVGIQLGIGGLQPFPALTVSETGYGDCKALTNYMHALLKQAGIISYPALVSSGVNIDAIFRDFPNFQQFDHVILCVPGIKDTIWLECTNQNMPFGFLGTFTDDRDVLLITGDGGRLAHTTRYGADDNLRTSYAEILIDPSGAANCTMKTQFRNLQYYDIFDLFNINSEEQKKWLNRNSSLPSQQLTDFKISNNKKAGPFATIDESLISKNYCSVTGNYTILPLNLVNAVEPVKKLIKARKSDFAIQRSSTDCDTLIYTIPPEFKITSPSAGRTINSAYGDYSYSVILDKNKVIYTRKLVIKQGRFKASEYKNFYDFFLAVSKADNEKIMLSR
jgi:hypothetical protein